MAGDRQVHRFGFGPFVVDTDARRVWRGGQAIALTPKAFALLEHLVRRRDALVTKADLFSRVWAGATVSDAALSRVLRELRLALGDDAAAPTFIETAHGQGLRFIAGVRDLPASGTAPFAPDAIAPPAPARALAGRETELARLDAALALARQGRRQVVLIEGDAGIGKTALVRTFKARHAQEADWCAAQGRCIEQYGQREAYGPILECLERLSAWLGAPAVRQAMEHVAPAWLAHLPWLADAPVSGEASTARMLRELAMLVERLARDRCLVLWLEDLHWSDPSTLDALAYLAGRREPAKLLILATLRPADAAAGGSPLPGWRQRLAHQEQARVLALRPLDREAVRTYVRDRLGPCEHGDEDGLVEVLLRRSGGNALFVDTLVSDLLDRHDVVVGERGWALGLPLDALRSRVPDTLRDLVRLQFGGLPEHQRLVILAAAVAGAGFCSATVAAALEQDLVDVEEACVQLAAAGRFLRADDIVRWPDGTLSAGWRFVHDLVWQALLEQVTPSRGVQCHRRIARRLELAYGEQWPTIAAQLAMHHESGQDAAAALRCLHRAGLAALDRCAYAEAMGLLGHGLQQVGQLPAADHDRARLDLLLPLGAAQGAALGFSSTPVLATWSDALELCRRCGRAGEIEGALRGYWNAALVRGNLALAHRLAQELLTRAEASGQPEDDFDALTRLGLTGLHRGEWLVARASMERALALNVDPGAALVRRERPRLLAYLSWALWHDGLQAQALQRGAEALGAAEETGNAHTLAFATGFVGFLNLFYGRHDAAAELARRQVAVSTEHGLPYWLAWGRFSLALAQARGRPDAGALATMAQAIEDCRSMGANIALPHFLNLHAQACLETGRSDDARRALEQSMEVARSNGILYELPQTLRLLAESQPARATGTETAGAQAPN